MPRALLALKSSTNEVSALTPAIFQMTCLVAILGVVSAVESKADGSAADVDGEAVVTNVGRSVLLVKQDAVEVDDTINAFVVVGF